MSVFKRGTSPLPQATERSRAERREMRRFAKSQGLEARGLACWLSHVSATL